MALVGTPNWGSQHFEPTKPCGHENPTNLRNAPACHNKHYQTTSSSPRTLVLRNFCAFSSKNTTGFNDRLQQIDSTREDLSAHCCFSVSQCTNLGNRMTLWQRLYLFFLSEHVFLDRFYNTSRNLTSCLWKFAPPPKEKNGTSSNFQPSFFRKAMFNFWAESFSNFLEGPFNKYDVLDLRNHQLTCFSLQASHSIASRMPRPKWRDCDPPLPPHVRPGVLGRGKDPPHFFAHRKLEHRGTMIAPWDPQHMRKT